jgi:hypothetical protein
LRGIHQNWAGVRDICGIEQVEDHRKCLQPGRRSLYAVAASIEREDGRDDYRLG